MAKRNQDRTGVGFAEASFRRARSWRSDTRGQHCTSVGKQSLRKAAL